MINIDYMISDLGVSINGGTPIAGWFIMEHSISMDDDWGTPIYGNHHLNFPRKMMQDVHGI